MTGLRIDMPVDEAMRTQRAIRRLKPDPVDPKLLFELLDLAQRAPTSGNLQPCEFVVVTDPHVKKKLARLNRIGHGTLGRVARAVLGDRPGAERTMAAVDWQTARLAEVPVLIVVCTRGIAVPFPRILSLTFHGSVFPAVQNLLLAARAAGLGAGLIMTPLWCMPLARRALGLPLTVTPCAVVPIGWPLGRYGPTTRRPVAEVVHFDRYGNRQCPPTW